MSELTDEEQDSAHTMINGDNSDYEIFYDIGYYDMWCVRNVNDKRFSSPTSFHFVHEDDAQEFKRLIEMAK
jgi:hypothetical protein